MFQCPPVPEPAIKTLVPVISAFIGGLIGIMGSYMAFLYQRRVERKSITAAFAAEIYALLEIIEKRDYVRVIKQDIESIKSGSRMRHPIPVTQTYFNVYFKNLDKIGLLKAPVSSKIVLFYTNAFALLEDFKTSEDTAVPWESDEQIGLLINILNMIESAQNLGYTILKQSGRQWKKQAAALQSA
jgi:hypothetical protein